MSTPSLYGRLFLLLALFVSTGHARVSSCGTIPSPAEIESVLLSQRNVFGRALFEIGNATQRAVALKTLSFPDNVEVKVRVVNCAGSKYQGFGKSLQELNAGFAESKIRFAFDGDGDLCTMEELMNISTFCIGDNDCSSASFEPISKRIRYTEGVLALVIDAPQYRPAGMAQFGLSGSNPWAMVKVEIASFLLEAAHTVTMPKRPERV
jgi:hypothetical protein